MLKSYFFLVFLFLVSFASAQLDNIENQIEGVSEDLENNITKVKEFTEKDKWDFIGSQWKEFLLKNKIIAGIDAFFTNINFVFLILFARDWSLSLEMLFTFMLWLATFLILFSYLSSYKKINWKKWLYSLGGSILLAQLQVFKILSSNAQKLILYKLSFTWRIITFIAVIVLIYLYLAINKVISKRIAISKEKNEVEDLKFKVEENEQFRKSVIDSKKRVSFT